MNSFNNMRFCLCLLLFVAWPMNVRNTLFRDYEFSYGAGHIDPVKALNPGLVYETLKEDYVEFLCSFNFDNSTLRKIFGNNTTTCTENSNVDKVRYLNYPSMGATVHKSNPVLAKFRRTLTNVGSANSTYKAKVTGPGTFVLNITVEPSILSFQALKERKSFTVTVTKGRGLFLRMSTVSLEWSDGVHSVRSPITLYARHDLAKQS